MEPSALGLSLARRGLSLTLGRQINMVGDAEADSDREARDAIWRAICVAAGDVKSRFQIESVRSRTGGEIRPTSPLPAVETWRLIEGLSLLCVILRSQRAVCTAVEVFGKTGPVQIQETSGVRHLWAQQTMAGDRSSLKARPDLVVTTSAATPRPANAVRVIDAKCVRQLGTNHVRGEFGKGHDLRVGSYLIWSFYSPSQRVVAGAKGLGIDIEALGFDTDRRKDFLANPDVLVSRVAHAQEQSAVAQRFLGSLEQANQDARRKLLGPAR